jgi:hypothetical protein
MNLADLQMFQNPMDFPAYIDESFPELENTFNQRGEYEYSAESLRPMVIQQPASQAQGYAKQPTYNGGLPLEDGWQDSGDGEYNLP